MDPHIHTDTVPRHPLAFGHPRTRVTTAIARSGNARPFGALASAPVDGGTAVGAAVSLSVQIFVAHAPLLKMYKPYAAMYSPALSFAGKLRATRPDFVAFEEVFCPSLGY